MYCTDTSGYADGRVDLQQHRLLDWLLDLWKGVLLLYGLQCGSDVLSQGINQHKDVPKIKLLQEFAPVTSLMGVFSKYLLTLEE